MKPEDLGINATIILGAIFFAFLLILLFMTLDKKKMNLTSFVASTDKFQLNYGIAFTILGLALLLPVLTGLVKTYECHTTWSLFGYNIELPRLTLNFLTYLIFIATALIIGTLLVINHILNKSKSSCSQNLKQ